MKKNTGTEIVIRSGSALSERRCLLVTVYPDLNVIMPWDAYIARGGGNNGSIPEPASLALLSVGLGALGFRNRKRKHSA